LTLTNCSLFANSADQGGAVANEAGASLTATGTSFNANHSTDPNAGFGGGANLKNGALHGPGKRRLTCNNAARDGGAVFSTGTLTASGVSFIQNSALFAGGILVYGSSSTANISGCTFTLNSATNYGGAIENLATATVTQSTFKSNSADYGG